MRAETTRAETLTLEQFNFKRDPAALRADGKGKRDTTHYQMKVEDNILQPLLSKLELSAQYRRRVEAISAWNQTSPVLKRGIAITPVKFGISFTATLFNQAGALVHVYVDGSVLVNAPFAEAMGVLRNRPAQRVLEAAAGGLVACGGAEVLFGHGRGVDLREGPQDQAFRLAQLAQPVLEQRAAGRQRQVVVDVAEGQAVEAGHAEAIGPARQHAVDVRTGVVVLLGGEQPRARSDERAMLDRPERDGDFEQDPRGGVQARRLAIEEGQRFHFG